LIEGERHREAMRSMILRLKLTGDLRHGIILR
jgi:hypothetical protein